MIDGTMVPRPRFTRWAAIYFLLYVCLPVMGVALLLDVALYLLFDRVFDRCYALLCLFR